MSMYCRGKVSSGGDACRRQSIIPPMSARRGLLPFKWLVYFGVIALLAVGMFAFFRMLRANVVVTKLVEGPVVRAVYATGTVAPEREFPVRATNEGTLEKVLVDKGSVVAAGQPLAQIVDPALIYAVDQAQSNLTEKLARADEKTSPVLAELDARIKATTEQLGIATREERRLREAFEGGGGSRSDVDRASDRTQTVWAALESYKSQRGMRVLELTREAEGAGSELKTAQWKLDQQTLKSPIDGVVLDRPKSQGTRVAVNEVILRVADVKPKNLIMRAAVDEEDITSVHVGQKVIMTLYAFEKTKFEGIVRTIYAEADANRRTFEVDIDILQSNDRFQPGMTGELAFVIQEKEKAMIVPSQAVQNGAIYVMRDGRITRLEPQVGVAAVDRVEIVSGLELEDQVIISPITPEMVGKSASVKTMDPREAAGLNKKDADKPFNPMR
jgi:multidrug efflux pump subunit AcrA (membrane-fusion protein)